MSLNNIKKMQSERGFTIVELLIVIVVIGILAAIVIVAYANVTRNANNSNYKANATQLQKVAEAVNADKGAYPTGTDDATLADATSGFNSGNTTKIPAGISVQYLAGNGAKPSNTTAQTLADSAAKTYIVRVCTAGVIVYYPVIGGNIASVTAGSQTGCTNI